MPDDPFDAAFLHKLEKLEIVYRRLTSGRGEGTNTGPNRGGRTEFRSHRPYAPGDDFRYIDWNVYSRTDSLFIKEHAREERRTVCVLLDCSASMAFGRPTKLHRAKQLAAALAYLALAAGDEAAILASAEEKISPITISGNKNRITDVFGELRQLSAEGGTYIERALGRIALGRRSLVVLISDLMVDEASAGVRRALATLSAKGFDPCVLQMLSREELAPEISGRLRLQDAESGEAHQLWLDADALQRYQAELNDFVESWRRFCSSHRILFSTARSDDPFDQLALTWLRKGGLVR